MSVPTTLDEWDLDVLVSMEESSLPESDRHDYKAGVPDGKDFRKLASAFANTRGGFVVVGMQQGNGKLNLAGIPERPELSKELHDKLHVDPSIELPMPKQVPYDDDRFIYIIDVPESNRKPHMPTPPDERYFWKRIEGACEQMSREEVKLLFERVETRIRRVQAALREVQDYVGSVQIQTFPNNEEPFLEDPPVHAAQTLREELSFLLDADQQILMETSGLGSHLKWIGSRIRLTISQAAPTGNNTLFQHHNATVRSRGNTLRESYNRLIGVLGVKGGELVPDDVVKIQQR